MRFCKTLILLTLVMGSACALSAWAQQKPFTQEQISNMVRDGFGDESGAKLIEQRGIDFAPAAGASKAFLNALRAAKPPEPASGKKPLNQVAVFALLVGQVPSHRVTMLVQEHGIDFEPTDDYLQEVRLAGGEDELISALKGAKVTKPATVDPAAEARQAEVRRHAARGAELKQKARYAEAEEEYRAALRLDPQNADLHASLAYVLLQQKKSDAGVSAARAALRLNPDNDLAHFHLGVMFGEKNDLDGAIVEFREALRLNPQNDRAHVTLGAALGLKGDRDGEIAQYREALRLNPKDGLTHVFIGRALEHKGNRDAAIAEYREALRVDPNNGSAHFYLGLELEKKGNRREALGEYRAAYVLNPNDTKYKQAYERLLREMNGP
jgi:tetratricopeptide (TPR) repeat protein